MNITVDATVQYVVKSVKINNLTLRLDKDGLTVEVPFSWLDAAGKVQKTGFSRYTEAQLMAGFQAQGQDFAPVAAVLKGLIPAGSVLGRNHAVIRISQDGEMTVNKNAFVDSGKGSWTTERLNAAQFASAIAPVPVQALTAMISAFTASTLL